MFKIVDTIDAIELERDFLESHANERGRLATLWIGLNNLAATISKSEKRLAPDTENVVGGFGNLPGLRPGERGTLECCCHWYALSASSFVQLFAWLNVKQKDTNNTPLNELITEQVRRQIKDYVKAVLPDVLVFRNKIAAHYALTDPRKDDNSVLLSASTMDPIGWSRGRLICGSPGGGFVVTRSRKDPETGQRVTQDSSALSSWTPTEVHEQLSKRYSFRSTHDDEAVGEPTPPTNPA